MKQDLKKKEVECTLYFAQERRDEIKGTSASLNRSDRDVTNGVRTLFNEFRDVFREGLLSGLPLKRAVDHDITGNEESSNRNAYQLSIAAEGANSAGRKAIGARSYTRKHVALGGVTLCNQAKITRRMSYVHGLPSSQQ